VLNKTAQVRVPGLPSPMRFRLLTPGSKKQIRTDAGVYPSGRDAAMAGN
jgi:hypothetical protein